MRILRGTDTRQAQPGRLARIKQADFMLPVRRQHGLGRHGTHFAIATANGLFAQHFVSETDK